MEARKAKILLIDDDKNFLEETRQLLEEAGYEGRVCPDSRKGLEEVQQYSPDCIILDMNMPALDGQDLLLLLHRKYPELPVIMCSGLSNMDERYLLKSGAMEVLQKPFSHQHLFAAIEQAIDRKDEATPVVLKGFKLRDIRDMVLRKVIVKALTRTNFNITHSAGLLGISRQCLLRYIKRLQISY